MLNALLFDLDGTMVDTDPIHFRTWQTILQPYHIEIDRPVYQKRFSGRRNPEILHDLLPDLPEDEVDRLSQYKEACFRDTATQLQPLAGLMDVLAWADQRQLKLGVVTNAPRDNAYFMLQALKLKDTFPTVILGDELPQGKPDPLPYQTALEELGVEASATIAFEDSPSGVRSAIAASIATVGIASTHAPDELSALGAALVVTDFSDPALLTWLEAQG